MLVETLEEWDRLRSAVAHAGLGLTLDVGHVPCTERIPPEEAIRSRTGQ
jgi:sugar phosphate isomerase/epimerase